MHIISLKYVFLIGWNIDYIKVNADQSFITWVLIVLQFYSFGLISQLVSRLGMPESLNADHKPDTFTFDTFKEKTAIIKKKTSHKFVLFYV